MAKFYGPIGFVEMVETSPGVHEEMIVERNYCGNVNRIVSRSQTTDQINDNINMSMEFSIVANPYAMDHYHLMRYVKFRGVAWTITSVTEQYPRLILSVGGVYNG